MIKTNYVIEIKLLVRRKGFQRSFSREKKRHLLPTHEQKYLFCNPPTDQKNFITDIVH